MSRSGSIDWLCWPRFDSAACFAALLGTAEHGRWLIETAGPAARVIRRYRGVKYRSARITFNGRVLASRKGNARVAAPIVLKGLPRGTFTIRIRVTTSKGRVLKGKRVYHTCVAKRPNHPAPRL